MIKSLRPDWNAPPTIAALCTTRIGGASNAPYDSLNLGLHVGDDEACVLANRRRLREQFELPAEPGWINQTHGTAVVMLERDQGRDADVAITRQPGLVAAVMVADCLPILLCNRAGSEVAAVHAGWRGLQAGVVEAAVGAMQSPASELLAWIGPGISREHFEVGEDVRDAFAAVIKPAQEFFSASGADRWLCDLPAIARYLLGGLGVGKISCDPHCSYRDRELFYSYRRDQVTGRMAALIWIRPGA